MAASLEETERRRLALVGDVAHELRTPLSTIEGYAEGLLDGVVESSPETFALLHREAGRLRRLVDDVQELTNLMGNALRHTPAGGQVTVRVHPSSRWIEFAVADTGIGIAPEHLR